MSRLASLVLDVKGAGRLHDTLHDLGRIAQGGSSGD
jgi:hypothetical protein